MLFPPNFNGYPASYFKAVQIYSLYLIPVNTFFLRALGNCVSSYLQPLTLAMVWIRCPRVLCAGDKKTIPAIYWDCYFILLYFGFKNSVPLAWNRLRRYVNSSIFSFCLSHSFEIYIVFITYKSSLMNRM